MAKKKKVTKKPIVRKGKLRVAINGFGRIGRAAFKILLENKEYEISVANKNMKQITNIADNIFKILNLQD